MAYVYQVASVRANLSITTVLSNVFDTPFAIIKTVVYAKSLCCMACLMRQVPRFLLMGCRRSFTVISPSLNTLFGVAALMLARLPRCSWRSLLVEGV